MHRKIFVSHRSILQLLFFWFLRRWFNWHILDMVDHIEPRSETLASPINIWVTVVQDRNFRDVLQAKFGFVLEQKSCDATADWRALYVLDYSSKGWFVNETYQLVPPNPQIPVRTSCRAYQKDL